MSASGLVQLWQVPTFAAFAIIVITIIIITIITTTTTTITIIFNGTYLQVRSVDQGKSSPAAGSLSSQRYLTDIALMLILMVMLML